jgi:hypothetical protein
MSRTRVCLLAGEPRGRERACCCRYDCRHDPSGDARQRSGTTRLGAHPWMLRLYPHAAHVSGYSSAAPSPPCQTSSHQEEAHQQPFRPFSSQPTDCGRSPGRRPPTLSSHGVRRPSPPPSASPRVTAISPIVSQQTGTVALLVAPPPPSPPPVASPSPSSPAASSSWSSEGCAYQPRDVCLPRAPANGRATIRWQQCAEAACVRRGLIWQAAADASAASSAAASCLC